MYISSIDNKEIIVKNNFEVNSDITKINIYGPYLEIEGYATAANLESFDENRIRKTLILIPRIDFDKYRKDYIKKNKNDEDYINTITNDEILEKEMYKCPLKNCPLYIVSDRDENSNNKQLSGFKENIDLASLTGGKPLKAGEYDLYIKLEQMEAGNDDIKYEKVIPLIGAQAALGGELHSTKLQYFSPKRALKYNLLISMDKYTKTLHFTNTLLQSYDPRKVKLDDVTAEGKKTKAIKRRLFKFMYILFCLLPIKHKKVVFASDSRSKLNGNFFFVYEELVKRNLDLKMKFLLSKRIDNKKSLFELLKNAYHFATAKVILLDDFYPMIYPLKIRKKADLVQVWHAAGAFKTFGFSRMGRPGGPSPKSKNHRNYTKVAVSSEGVRKNYAEGFGIPIENVYATGVARSDVFFDKKYKDYVTNTLHKRYPFINGKKVILFAPTFRGNGQNSAHYPFEVINFKKVYEELHEEYVFLFKIHPFVKNKLDIPFEYADFFYDLSDYREINDLLLITDLLITDYSSVCFEFALLGKPMLFFAFDVDKYILNRDFYYNYFDFIPGPLVTSTEEMLKVINEQKYEMEKIEPFVQYFFDDTLGNASKNIVDRLIIDSLYENQQQDLNESIGNVVPKSRMELFNKSIETDEN